MVITVVNYKQELSSCWDGRPFGHNRHGPKSGEGLLWTNVTDRTGQTTDRYHRANRFTNGRPMIRSAARPVCDRRASCNARFSSRRSNWPPLTTSARRMSWRARSVVSWSVVPRGPQHGTGTVTADQQRPLDWTTPIRPVSYWPLCRTTSVYPTRNVVSDCHVGSSC